MMATSSRATPCDPYGNVTFLKADWSLQEVSGHADGTASAYDNPILFAGYYRDTETALYHVRNRMYHVKLGLWLQRDPEGYVDGMSLYAYVGGASTSSVDPAGLTSYTWDDPAFGDGWGRDIRGEFILPPEYQELLTRAGQEWDAAERYINSGQAIREYLVAARRSRVYGNAALNLLVGSQVERYCTVYDRAKECNMSDDEATALASAVLLFDNTPVLARGYAGLGQPDPVTGQVCEGREQATQLSLAIGEATLLASPLWAKQGPDRAAATAAARAAEYQQPVGDEVGRVFARVTGTEGKELSVASARRKAVQVAWEQERALVQLTGRGTRRWTPAEARQLLETGRVTGYQGHHINSILNSSQVAGNPYNVVFKTRPEHFAAHAFNWRTPTFGPLVKR
jgi:RHS repeat-associated protein